MQDTSIPFDDLWHLPQPDSGSDESEYSKVYSVEMTRRARHDTDDNDADRSDDSDLEIDDDDSEAAHHHLFGRRVSKDITRYGMRASDDGCDGSMGIAKVIAARLQSPPPQPSRSKLMMAPSSKFSDMRIAGKLDPISALNSEELTSTSGMENSDSTNATRASRKVIKKKREFNMNDFNAKQKAAKDYSKLGYYKLHSTVSYQL